MYLRIAEHVHFVAMEIELEKPLSSLVHGEVIHLVVRPMWVGERSSLACSNVHGFSLLTDIVLPNMPKVTIFEGRVEFRSNRLWICKTNTTVTIGHPAIRDRDFHYMRETCAGIGCVSTGFEKCGVKTSVYNDANMAFCQWLKQNGKRVIHGDINDISVVKEMAKSPGMFMSAGIACQPFSRLGDGRQQFDERSQSFPGTMTAGYLLQAQVFLLECTPAVQTSEWVQGVLASFAKQTGFKVQQQLLDLHTFWVSKRTRWWCTVSHPALNLQPIPSIPKMPFNPTFLHLFSKMMDIPESDMNEIELDLYELRHFHGYPFLEKHLVDTFKTLPTATHSWGSQVKACSCGCRNMGFSHSRLEEKGLYGQLVLTGGEVMHGGQPYRKCRHLHACEIALANGLNPKHVGRTKGKCRLEIAGVGQMASPFQGAWVLANVLKDIHQHAFPLKDFQEPIDVLQSMAQELLWARDKLLGYPKTSPSNEIFSRAIQMWGQSPTLPAQVQQSRDEESSDSSNKIGGPPAASEVSTTVYHKASEAKTAAICPTSAVHVCPTHVMSPKEFHEATFGSRPDAPGQLHANVTVREAKDHHHLQGFSTGSDHKAFEAGTAAVFATTASEAGSGRQFKHPSMPSDGTLGTHTHGPHLTVSEPPGFTKSNHVPCEHLSGSAHKASEAGTAAICLNTAFEAGVGAQTLQSHVTTALEAGVGTHAIHPKQSHAALGFQTGAHAHDPQDSETTGIHPCRKEVNVPARVSSHKASDTETATVITSLPGIMKAQSLIDGVPAPEGRHHTQEQQYADSSQHVMHGSGKPSDPNEMDTRKAHAASPYPIQAKPLPRLGCGGPAPMDEPQSHDEQCMEGESVIPKDMVRCLKGFMLPCTAAMMNVANQAHVSNQSANQVRPMPDSKLPTVTSSGNHAHQIEPSNPIESNQMPFAHAGPPPRLGCGGPTKDDPRQADLAHAASGWPTPLSLKDRSDLFLAKYSDSQHGLKEMIHKDACQVKIQSDKTSDAQIAAVPKDPHAPTHLVVNHESTMQGSGKPPPTCLQAMPLPRLGCGGPAPMNMDEEQVWDPWMKAIQARTMAHQDAQQTNDQNVAKSVQAAPPTSPDAMPSPRLGCEGPAQPEVPDQTKEPGSIGAGKNNPVHAQASRPSHVHPDTGGFVAFANPHHRPQTIKAASVDAKGSQCQATAPNAKRLGNHPDDEKSAKQLKTHAKPCQEEQVGMGGIYDSPSQDEINKAILKHLDGHAAGPCEEPIPGVAGTHFAMATQLDKADTAESQEEPVDNEPDLPDLAVHVVTHTDGMMTHGMSSTCTAADIASAMSRLGVLRQPIRVSTAMGTQLSQQDQIKHNHFLLLEESSKVQTWKCPKAQDGEIPDFQGLTREQALWTQKGWVAHDEMTYYMHMLESYHPSSTFGVVQIPSDPDRNVVVARTIIRALSSAGQDVNSRVKAIAFLHNHHWFPCVVEAQGDEAKVYLPPHESEWIIEAFASMVGQNHVQFHADPMPHAFPADCGFQTIGWILAKMMDDETTQPFTVRQACQWRSLFHQNLIYTGLAKQMVSELKIGGTLNPREQLQRLIEAHGVQADQSAERAEQIVQALGLKAIQQILVSPKPWADLKARANLHQPPLRIVTADELKDVIQRRMKDPQQVGKKQNKIKNTKITKPKMQLTADQVAIPEAVFRQEDGHELSQIYANQINPNAMGVVLVSVDGAIPYFNLKSPVSQQGIALLIIDHDDARLPPSCQVTKVPAKCIATNEPMIVSLAMMQIGAKQVVRNLPAQCLQVPEVDNQVIRVQVYKDQASAKWDEFIQKPVKNLLSAQPFADLASAAILDVWDRQYMTNRMMKVPVPEAQLFMVNLRVETSAIQAIMSANGEDGKYYELRRSDGRQPDDAYQVVWLPGKTFAEAQVIQRASHIETALVRQTHWVFQMAHGDVLVSPEDKEQVPAISKPTVLASSKTMHSLQVKPKEHSKEDPWLHNDPWRSPAAPSTRELSVGQVASIQANVEKVILAKLRDDDDSMNGGGEHRIAALEQKLDQLTTQVSTQQHEQMQHNQQVQVQMQSLDIKIDQQQNAFQSALDSKLEQQMIRIEQLFSKRPRTGE